jgi:hypothetical protein
MKSESKTPFASLWQLRRPGKGHPGGSGDRAIERRLAKGRHKCGASCRRVTQVSFAQLLTLPTTIVACRTKRVAIQMGSECSECLAKEHSQMDDSKLRKRKQRKSDPEELGGAPRDRGTGLGHPCIAFLISSQIITHAASRSAFICASGFSGEITAWRSLSLVSL